MSYLTKNIGVSVLEDTVCASFFMSGEAVVIPLRLPAGVRRDNALTEPGAFRRVIECVCGAVERYGRSWEPQFVVTVPDAWGLRELMAFRAMARAEGVPVLRTLTESSAVGLDMQFRGSTEPRFVVIVTALCGAVEAEEFDLADGVVEKVCSYLPEGYKDGSPVFNRRFQDIPLDMSRASAIFCVGDSEQSRLAALRAIKNFLPERELRFYQAESRHIAAGAAVECAVLEGSCTGILLLDSLTPYGLYLSAEREFMTAVAPHALTPAREEREIDWAGQDRGLEVTFYERRGDRFPPLGLIRILPEELRHLRPGKIVLSVASDADKRLALLLRDRVTGAERQIPFEGRLVPPEKSGGTRVSVSAPDSGAEHMAREFFPLLDSLMFGVQSAEDRNDPDVEGLRSMYEQGLEILRRSGITPIEAEGRPFDCNIHNAVGHVVDRNYPPNTVIRVVQTGFMCGGKVLRYPAVIVAN